MIAAMLPPVHLHVAPLVPWDNAATRVRSAKRWTLAAVFFMSAPNIGDSLDCGEDNDVWWFYVVDQSCWNAMQNICQ